MQLRGLNPSGRDVSVGHVAVFRSLPSGTRFAQTIRRLAVPQTGHDARRSLLMPLRF
ncbi:MULTISPECIES: hypothetical protein [Sanguibacteroides]|uniref:hypothetical protein n=1 Tax=Sanguibacteroides TaxID=1635148 RepID=UPI0013636202|nr:MULTISPECIES: hypothetical protein [Sanguibacteroides]